MPGNALAYADFYALIPAESAITVAPGADVSFPLDNAKSGTEIMRLSASSFNLAENGVYLVMFQASVNESGQLVVTLNGVELPYTVVGRATGTSQIVGVSLIKTTDVNSVITVRNPVGNSESLTLTDQSGGESPVSAHLVIIQFA